MSLPKPYYEDPWCQIFHGDCREILPELQAGVLVTDPVWPNASVPLEGRDRPEALFAEMWMAGDFYRAAVQIGCATPPWFLGAINLPFFRHCWLEIARVWYKGRLLMTGDVALLFGEPPKSKPGGHVIPSRCIDTDSSGKQSEHPCPRKLGHVQWLVRWWTEERDLVIDPFMGSGTTLLACKGSGRKSIGIEIEEKYCAMAVERLRQEVFAL